jgi:Tol biopolymer transport system component
MGTAVFAQLRRFRCTRLLGALTLCSATLFASSVIRSDEPDDTATARKALFSELQNSPHRILFESYDKNNWELFVMNADGSSRRNLTGTPKIHELYPQASPDGSKICFLADVGQGRDILRSVYFMNADSSKRTLVAEKARQPCWSPDGTKIAFLKQEFKRFNVTDYVSKGLFIYDVETGKTTEVPNKKIHHLYNLAWSADGDWIVSTVHGGMGYGHAILAIEIDGFKVVDLKLKGCRPCLSPDGKRVTWSSNDHTVNVADIDFSGDQPRTKNTRIIDQRKKLHLYHPDFSPDGKYVTYSVGPGGRVPASGPGTHTQVAEMIGVRGQWNLFLRRSDGRGPVVQLTEDASMSNEESEWLPSDPFKRGSR